MNLEGKDRTIFESINAQRKSKSIFDNTHPHRHPHTGERKQLQNTATEKHNNATNILEETIETLAR